MDVKALFSNKTVGSYINLVSTVLTLVIIIAYTVTTKAANSFSGKVLMYLVFSFAFSATYFFISNKFAEISIFISIAFITLSLGTFAINSINTFADVLNGISMFGSTGGIKSIVVILIMMGIVTLLQIITSFTGRFKA